ncbi:MAG: enoyl-CoA hydratase/isomerase family protein [Candidatus Azotimanducaceae bacterium WSBS_2022_MAG_OTU7]
MASLVEFEYIGIDRSIAVARMVREKSLNSLLLDTIDQLAEKIYAWLDDANIACIILDSSSEKAFCAGADITALYHSIKESRGGDNPYAAAFFLNEYKLDYAIHTAKKPIIAWGNGIVMGGGLGLLGGCSHRVGTPVTRIAMPEITIGLFPDAGGTYILSKLPDHLGVFAGLTGCMLSSGDAIALELLDVVVAQASKQAIIAKLGVQHWTKDPVANAKMITQILSGFAVGETLPTNLLNHREAISTLVQSCFDAENFFDAFDPGLSTLPADEWLAGAVSTYQSGSPTTARIFLEQIRRSKGMTLEEMFQMELIVAYQCIQHPDFPEGVRALLVDKDKNPAWVYQSANDVPEAYLDEHFQPVWPGPHPLGELGSNA